MYRLWFLSCCRHETMNKWSRNRQFELDKTCLAKLILGKISLFVYFENTYFIVSLYDWCNECSYK